MENIGIDLGTSKTILTTSKNNGAIVFDNLGSRSIRTILELTQPLRKFGNNVLEPRRKDINKRKRVELTDHENLFYFINYLRTLTNASTCSLTVPYHLSYKERHNLVRLFKAANMNVNIINDITAIGMFYALKYEQCKERFAIIDCGHSKTTFGIFEKIDNNIKPVLIKGTQVGGRDFDHKLMDFVMKKYNMEDTPFVREKVYLQMDKLKSSLNHIDEYRFVIEIMEEQFVIDVTKEEYLSVIGEDLQRLKDFFAEISSDVGDLSVEIVGGNCFNLLVRELLEEAFKCCYALDAFESASFGACFMGTIMKFGSRVNYTVNDIFFHTLYSRTYGIDEDREAAKLTQVFGTKNVPFDGYKVTINKNSDFEFDLLTDSDIVVSGKVTEVCESVDLIVNIPQNGIIEVKVPNGKISIEEPDFTTLLESEKAMRQTEQEFLQCGSMRNELEHVLMNLNIANITSEQSEVLAEVKNSLVFYPMSERVADEQVIRDEVSLKLGFVVDMVKDKIEAVKMAYNLCFEEVEKLMKEKKAFSSIRTSYKLQGLVYSKKEALKKLRADIFNACYILDINIENEVKEIETLKVQCEREIVEKEKEVEKKEAEKKEAEKKEAEKKEVEKKEAEMTKDEKNTETKNVEAGNEASEKMDVEAEKNISNEEGEKANEAKTEEELRSEETTADQKIKEEV